MFGPLGNKDTEKKQKLTVNVAHLMVENAQKAEKQPNNKNAQLTDSNKNTTNRAHSSGAKEGMPSERKKRKQAFKNKARKSGEQTMTTTVEMNQPIANIARNIGDKAIKTTENVCRRPCGTSKGRNVLCIINTSYPCRKGRTATAELTMTRRRFRLGFHA